MGALAGETQQFSLQKCFESPRILRCWQELLALNFGRAFAITSFISREQRRVFRIATESLAVLPEITAVNSGVSYHFLWPWLLPVGPCCKPTSGEYLLPAQQSSKASSSLWSLLLASFCLASTTWYLTSINSSVFN